jgi:hypothetical protein
MWISKNLWRITQDQLRIAKHERDQCEETIAAQRAQIAKLEAEIKSDRDESPDPNAWNITDFTLTIR